MGINFEYDEVISVEAVSSSSLRYDITVQDNHNFFANNILVHNCQNLVKRWNNLQRLVVETTEKLEGSSMTVGFINDEFCVCSRNINLKETEANTYWTVARQLNIEEKLLGLHMTNYILQGELIGLGIQNNYYNLNGYDFYVFSVFDMNTHKYLLPEQRRQVIEELGLKHVPVIHEQFEFGNMTVSDVLEMADGESIINPSKLREGLVFKQVNGREHWKAVSNQFLLKLKD